MIPPRPAKKCGNRQIVKRGHLTLLDGDASILIWVSPTLGSDSVVLLFHGLPWLYGTVLEDCSSIAKNEINGAYNLALSIELTIGMRVESVLICIEGAAMKD